MSSKLHPCPPRANHIPGLGDKQIGSSEPVPATEGPCREVPGQQALTAPTSGPAPSSSPALRHPAPHSFLPLCRAQQWISVPHVTLGCVSCGAWSWALVFVGSGGAAGKAHSGCWGLDQPGVLYPLNTTKGKLHVDLVT